MLQGVLLNWCGAQGWDTDEGSAQQVVEAVSSSSGVVTYVAPPEVQRQQDVQRLLVRQAEEREELEQRRLVTRELERAARPQRLRRPSAWLQQRYP